MGSWQCHVCQVGSALEVPFFLGEFGFQRYSGLDSEFVALVALLNMAWRHSTPKMPKGFTSTSVFVCMCHHVPLALQFPQFPHATYATSYNVTCQVEPRLRHPWSRLQTIWPNLKVR